MVCIFRKHPIYEEYGANNKGEIISYSCLPIDYYMLTAEHNIDCEYLEKDMEPCFVINFYDRCEILYPINRFVWECFNGVMLNSSEIIPRGTRLVEIPSI